MPFIQTLSFCDIKQSVRSRGTKEMQELPNDWKTAGKTRFLHTGLPYLVHVNNPSSLIIQPY